MADMIFPELLNIGIFIILAVGLNIINGFTGMFSLGHAGFFAVGAYAAMLYMNYFAPELYSSSYFLHFGIGILVAMAVAGILGLCVGLPCLRLAGDYLAIATLAFGEIVRIFLESFRTDILGGATGLDLKTDAIDSQWGLLITFVLLSVIILLTRNLKNSATGRALLAIRENEIAAQVMGINVALLKVQAFVIGSALAGLAGALFAYSRSLIAPTDFNLLKTIMILLMIVLGGLGSLSGAVVGALLLGLVERLLIPYLPEVGMAISENETLYDILSTASTNPQIIFALLLIIMIRLRPQGIFGTKEISDFFKKKPLPPIANKASKQGGETA